MRAPELRDRVKAFLAELVRERDAAEAAEKDRRMVERLAAIHNDLGVHNDAAQGRRRVRRRLPRLRRRPRPDAIRRRPAACSAASPAAADLANALDHWAFLRRGPALRDPAGGTRLVAAARAADPDPWRNRLRDTLGRMGGDPARKLEALERLAATADVDHLPGASVTRLATALAFLGRRDTGDRAPAAGPGVAPRRLLGQRRPRTRADGLRPSRGGGPVLRRRRGHQAPQRAGPEAAWGRPCSRAASRRRPPTSSER